MSVFNCLLIYIRSYFENQLDSLVVWTDGWMSLLFCPQVHGMALLQGVQEGGEMNAPPLPPEERQQFVERGFHRPWRLKTEAFGSFTTFFFFVFFYFFFVHLARCGGRNPPPHLSSSGKNLSFFPLLQICKVSRTWKLNFCFLTTQTADAWGISGAEFKKNKPCCWSLLRRNKKITRY